MGSEEAGDEKYEERRGTHCLGLGLSTEKWRVMGLTVCRGGVRREAWLESARRVSPLR